MAAFSQSESRRMYSWWWDSHISPKNSKWLLEDMDAKVKSMINLIEGDGDSFARRAEIYFKKRPELMNLLEDFYRAYRALAGRYIHTTSHVSHESPDCVCVVGAIEKALVDMQGEKEDALVKYQQCLTKLSNMEDQAETWKEAVVGLEAEKRDGLERISKLEEQVLCQRKDFLEKILLLENSVSVSQNMMADKDIQLMENQKELEKKLLHTQARLKAAENLNLRLCKHVDELENDIRESVKVMEILETDLYLLSDINSAQKLKIKSLHMVKTGLKKQLCQLREEMEDKISIQSFHLGEKKKELKLWDKLAEVCPVQTSAVDGLLYRDKLAEVCPVLEEENNSKGRISSMECEISRLNSQLHAYGPVVDAPRDDIALEHYAFLQKKLLKSCHNQETVDPIRGSSEILPQEDHYLVSLHNSLRRIQVIGMLMQEANKPTSHTTPSSKLTTGEPLKLENLQSKKDMDHEMSWEQFQELFSSWWI